MSSYLSAPQFNATVMSKPIVDSSDSIINSEVHNEEKYTVEDQDHDDGLEDGLDGVLDEAVIDADGGDDDYDDQLE